MMEWHILPGYVREDEIRQLFEEYTALLLAGDPEFAGYLALQHYEDELSHPARKYAPPAGCTWPAAGAGRRAASR